MLSYIIKKIFGNNKIDDNNNNYRFIIERNITDNITIGCMNIYNNLINDDFIPVKNTTQGIKYNNNYYYLLQFYKINDKLVYKFTTLKYQNELNLEIYKYNDIFMYKLYHNNKCVENNYIDNVIVKNYKKISVNSKELDSIFDYFNSFYCTK